MNKIVSQVWWYSYYVPTEFIKFFMYPVIISYNKLSDINLIVFEMLWCHIYRWQIKFAPFANSLTYRKFNFVRVRYWLSNKKNSLKATHRAFILTNYLASTFEWHYLFNCLSAIPIQMQVEHVKIQNTFLAFTIWVYTFNNNIFKIII